MNARRLSAALTALVLLLGLSGCLRLQADVTIRNDREVGFTVRTGAKYDPKQPPQPDPCTDPQFQGGKKTPYNDGEYNGCLYELTTSIGAQKVDGLTITRNDGVYDVTWRVPARAAQDGVKPESVTSFKVSVTFPGDVVTHNGSSTVSGRTVTWTDPKDFFSSEGLHATGKEGADPSGLTGLWWVAVLAGVALAGAIAAGLLLVRRRPART